VELALLEAGHVGHAIYLVATSLGLGCRALGVANVASSPFYASTGIDRAAETVVYVVAVGRVKDVP